MPREIEINDRFHFELLPEIDSLFQRSITKITAATADTADQLGLKTAHEQGYIRALQDVKDVCWRVERKMYGRPDEPAKGDD